ncbi:hypothetical protein [Streptomyces sp. NPDC048584]|uniref:hypothetical protein n=1 Tax=Streptomyces sp. NPDC048584 TaxID=3365573 RepID=UPI0037245164
MAGTYILVIKDRSSIPTPLTQFTDQAGGARSGPGRFLPCPDGGVMAGQVVGAEPVVGGVLGPFRSGMIQGADVDEMVGLVPCSVPVVAGPDTDPEEPPEWRRRYPVSSWTSRTRASGNDSPGST